MYDSLKAQKGIQFDSDSDPDEPKARKTGGGAPAKSFGAMDNLLTGFGAIKAPIKPPVKKEEPKVTKPVEVKPATAKPTPPPVVKQTPPPPPVVKPPPPPAIVKAPVVVPPPPKPEEQFDDRIPRQPQPYYFPNGIPEFEGIIPVSDVVVCLVRYIRKLKKVAENFGFNQFNKRNTEVQDVLRLSECYYDEIKKRKEADFSDYEFPANYTAFVDNSKEKGLGTFIDHNHWKGAGETFQGPCFGKYIDPNDIERGLFHSEYLVSCLASLAENEANIKRLIEEQELTKTNFYYVRVNQNGVWRYIAVDDQVPSHTNGKLVVSHSFVDPETELWPSVIEKAYTKVYGTFEQYTRNQSREAYLRDLTGAPVRTYLPNTPAITERVRKALESGYVVQAVPNAKIQEKGLNPNYTLSVIGVNSRGSYEIRNSFGTLDQKSKFNISKDGVFELAQSDALQTIAYFLIAEIHSTYATSTVQCKMKRGFYSSYSFKIKRDFHGYLTVSQFDQRLFPESHNVFTDKSNITIDNPSQYSYSPVRALIYRRERDGTYIYVNSGYSTRKNLDVEVNLDAGEYVVILLALWKSEWYDLNFSLYGTELVSFKKVYNKFDPSIIAKGLQDESLARGVKSSKGGVEESVYLHQPSGLIFVTASNPTGKGVRHTRDFGKARVDDLFLLSNKTKGEAFGSFGRQDLESYRDRSFQDKQWWVDLDADEKWSWVFATEDQFDDNSFKSLGGR